MPFSQAALSSVEPAEPWKRRFSLTNHSPASCAPFVKVAILQACVWALLIITPVNADGRIGDKEVFDWDFDNPVQDDVTGVPSQTAEESDSEEDWRSVIGTTRTEVRALERIFVGLALIVTLIAAIAWASRRRSLIGGPGYVTLVEDMTVAPGVRIMILEMFGRVMVTAYTDKGLTLLTEITDEELVEYVRLEAGRRNTAGTFKDALGRWMDGTDKAPEDDTAGFIQRGIDKLKRSRNHL